MNAVQPCILVCDDEASARTSVSVVLNLAGYRVETANDGEEALTLIRRQPERYHLVLTDNAMPRLDGIGLVRRLRTDNYEGKIMVLSGCLDAADYEAFNDLAVDDIMFKPFNVHEFRETVSHLIAGENRQVCR